VKRKLLGRPVLGSIVSFPKKKRKKRGNVIDSSSSALTTKKYGFPQQLSHRKERKNTSLKKQNRITTTIHK